jgi:hypothetical protein
MQKDFALWKRDIELAAPSGHLLARPCSGVDERRRSAFDIPYWTSSTSQKVGNLFSRPKKAGGTLCPDRSPMPSFLDVIPRTSAMRINWGGVGAP